MLKSFLIGACATLLALVSFADAQTTNPLKYVTTHPGGACNFLSVPQFDYQDGTYWACRGTFTGNPATWTNGTWTKVTPPTTVVAGDGKGSFQTATSAQVYGLFPANTIQFVSVPLTLSALQTLNSIPVQVIAAPGANSMIEIDSCVLNLTYGAAAFTGGGTVTIGYGTGASVAAAATIASTVFTTFTSSHAIKVAGSLAVTADTSLANQPIYVAAASADFAAGTGATGQLDCAYRVHTGIL